MLTVIGEHLARRGLEFEYVGETDAGCAPCKLRKVCHAVEPGRSYKVTAVRPVKHDVCHVYEGKVQVVEVARQPLRLNVSAASLRGTMVTRRFEECGFRLCPYRSACAPRGLAEGGRAAILIVGDKVDCAAGRDLRLVTAEKA